MRKALTILLTIAIVAGFLVVGPPPGVAATERHVYAGESIQAAIDSASENDTIIVHPGTYEEQILIDKPLTFRSSDNAEVTIIDGGEGTANHFHLPPFQHPPPGSPSEYTYYPVVRIDVDGVVFQGLTVRDSAPIIGWLDQPIPYECGMAIAVMADNCTLEDNILPSVPWGIFAQGSGNVISGNAIQGLLDPGDLFASSLEGIYVRGNSNQVNDNVISVGGYGIWVAGMANQISGNETSLGFAGISAASESGWPGAYNEISGNYVYDSSNAAIGSWGSSYSVISGNFISKQKNTWAGYGGVVLAQASYCQILNNTISDVLGGISLNNSDDNVISGNVISHLVASKVEVTGEAKLRWTGEKSMFGLTSAMAYSGKKAGDGVVIKVPYSIPLSLIGDPGPMFWAYLYDVNARPKVNFVLDTDEDGSADETMAGVDTGVVCPDYWEPQVGCDNVAEAWRAMSPVGGYYDPDNSAGLGWDATPATTNQWRAQFPNAVILETQTIYGMWDNMSEKTAYLDGHFDGSRWGIEQSGVGIGYQNSYHNSASNNTVLDALIVDSVSEDIVGAQTDHAVSGSSGSATTVTVTTTSGVTVTVTLYAQNPEPTVPFPDTALGKFVDIQVSRPDAIVWPARVEVTYTAAEVTAAGVDEDTLALYYWDYEDGSFQKCSDTGVDTASKTIWAKVTENEGHLVGTPFAPGGETLTAVNDNYSTGEDGILSVAAANGILSNDSDPDNDPLTAQLVGNVGHGVLVLNTDGSFTYTPSADFNGTDSFVYKATDGQTNSNVATVSIMINSVNDAPSAADDAWTVQEDTSTPVVAPGVLGNDSDVEGSLLTAVLVSTVSHGTLSLGSNGSFTYVPSPDFNGTDSFTYKASDGTNESSLATVTLTVAAVNDPPQVSDDIYEMSEGDTLSEDPPGVLANDSDVDSASLTAILVSDASHGKLGLNGDGSFTYTPESGFDGTDSFTYKANDGTADSSAATVTITVNPGKPGGLPAWAWALVGVAGALVLGGLSFFVVRRMAKK
jgi:parallel beta-helix repeat protein/VCBS repeat-containing protein